MKRKFNTSHNKLNSNGNGNTQRQRRDQNVCTPKHQNTEAAKATTPTAASI